MVLRQVFDRLRQRQQAAAETAMEQYRRLLKTAVASGDLVDREAVKLLDLGAELGRDVQADAAIVSEAEQLAKQAEQVDRLRDEVQKAATVAAHHRQESERIAEQRGGEQARLDGAARQRRGELTTATDAVHRLARLRQNNAALLAWERPQAYLLPDKTEQSIREEFHQRGSNLRLALHDTADGQQAAELRERLDHLARECEQAVKHLHDQEKAIRASGIHACRVNSGSVQANAPAWLREYTFTLAPKQSPAEFAELKSLVEKFGKSYATRSEALAAV